MGGQCCARDWEAGGLLLGEPLHGELTGYCTYIYPDLGTALVGTFKKGLMTAAQAATVTSLSIVDDIPYTKCSPCYGPVFSYSPPTKSSFGPSDPLLRDPFEKKLVEVRQSSISGGGEGVFAL